MYPASFAFGCLLMLLMRAIVELNESFEYGWLKKAWNDVGDEWSAVRKSEKEPGGEYNCVIAEAR